MPFHKIKSPGRVIIDVAMGKRPNIADYDTCPILQEQPRLWELFQRCWMMAPEERPGIEEIVMEMDEIVSAAQ